MVNTVSLFRFIAVLFLVGKEVVQVRIGLTNRMLSWCHHIVRLKDVPETKLRQTNSINMYFNVFFGSAEPSKVTGVGSHHFIRLRLPQTRKTIAYLALTRHNRQTRKRKLICRCTLLLHLKQLKSTAVS